MQPNLARYQNKTILVSIPALFEDAVCRPYKLLGAEINGLWLQSEELTARLLPPESGDLARLQPVVFVPFAQMAGVLVATGVPEPPATAAAPPGPAKHVPSREELKHHKSGEGRPKKGPGTH
jgi:hypothetical protein